jgi:hypothetical protein
VPGGILSLAFFPSMVGTSTSPPRIAVVIEIGIWQKIFSSSLSNTRNHKYLNGTMHKINSNTTKG